MEKLIELLNEYELGEDYGDMGEYYYIDTLGNIVDDGGYILKPCEIISKKFGFLQRLVEHNKLLHPNFVQHLKLFYGDTMPEWNYYIMMLSIADSPIAELNKMLRPY